MAARSDEPRVVIVGGVAGGMSTATRLRRNLEHAHVVVLERGEHVSYANCGLPYHLGGVIAERDDLLLQTPEALHDRFAIDVRTRTEATAIDTAARTVRARDLRTGTEELLEYDHLVLAPGAAPIMPPIPGAERAYVLRTVTDLDRIIDALEHGVSSAVVLGAGFVGIEVAENLVHRGVRTTVVELADQVLGPLDPELAVLVQQELERHDVDVRLGNGAAAIEEQHVVLGDGGRIDADLVIAAVGVRPDTSLARDAGIALDPRGAIIVDDHQRTSAANVYAVGDAATKVDAVDASDVIVPLAQTANRHGRLVADVIAGRDVAARPVLGTAVVAAFALVAATTGWSEKRLRATGRTHRIVHVHPLDHAGYYPGAEPMSLKLLIDPETDEILGAQGVGGRGVDKRIDVIATAMRGGIRASELADLELAYAPQFGSAKDPVNMLGFVADNLASGRVRSVQWHELDEVVADGAAVLDVRNAAEHANGSIPGAVNLPLDELRTRHGELPDAPLVVHCEVGVRANVAARLLEQLGYDVRMLDGSYRTWRAGTATLGATVTA